MMRTPKPLEDPQIRFMFDNLIDSVKDQTLLLWEALDTHTNDKVWMLGRNLGQGRVLPMGRLMPDTNQTVKRFAPANMDGTWDMTQIKDKQSQ